MRAVLRRGLAATATVVALAGCAEDPAEVPPPDDPADPVDPEAAEPDPAESS